MRSAWISILSLLASTALAQRRPQAPVHAGFGHHFGEPPKGVFPPGSPPSGFRYGPPAGIWGRPSGDCGGTTATIGYTSSAVSVTSSLLSATVISTTTTIATSSTSKILTSSSVLGNTSPSSSSSTTESSSLESTSTSPSGVSATSSISSTSTTASITESSSTVSSSTSLAISSGETSTSSSSESSSIPSTSSASSTTISTSSTTTGSSAPMRTSCLFQDTLFFFQIYSGSPDADPKAFYNSNGTSVLNIIRDPNPANFVPNCYTANQCSATEQGWYANVPGVLDFVPVTVPSLGGAAEIYIDGTAASGLSLDDMAASFYCANGTLDVNGTIYDDGTTDALLTLEAVGNEDVHVPYQCGQELRFYSTGATAPSGCESVTLRAVTIPAA